MGSRSGNGYYASEPPPRQATAVELEVEQKSARDLGCCTIVAIALFIILILVVLIALIIFFTIGKSETAPAYTVTQQYLRSDQVPVASIAGAGNLVSASFVETALYKGNKICLLDTAYLAGNRKLANFEQEHIQGSRHFNIDEVIFQTPIQRRNLKHPLEFQEYVRSLGIDRDCHVVLYAHDEGQTAVITASYVWWLFKVYGLDNVSVMDGGLKEWKRKDRVIPLESGPVDAPSEPGNFVASWRPQFIITYDDVLANFETKAYKLVDARPFEQFEGRERNPLAAQAGRIRDAINIPTTSLLTDAGLFRSPADIRRLLENQGVTAATPVIVYCNTALQASALYLAMIMSDVQAKSYDGSWVEWSKRAPDTYKILGPG